MPIKVYDRGSYTLEKKAELDFEHQLAILTTSQLMEKLPILGPYAVGFETIKKNDDGTEGIGLGIYMIGKQIIYIPSFYRKNNLKTGLFMILADSNTFRPATEEWISIIREQNEKKVGELIEKGDAPEVRAGAPSAIRSREFLDPISKTAKKASSCQALWDHFCKQAAKAQAMPDLNVMDVALELGKEASKTLIDTMANDTRFLNDMLKGYTPDQIDMFKTAALSLYPNMYEDKKPEKKTEEFATLVNPFDKTAKTLTKSEQQKLQQDGFFIKTASDSIFAEVLDGDAAEATELSTVSEPAVYKLLPVGSDEFEVAVVLKPFWYDWYGEPSSYDPINRYDTKGKYNDMRESPHVAIITDHTGTDSYMKHRKNLVGIKLVQTPQQFLKVIAGLGEALGKVDRLEDRDVLLTPYGQVMEVHKGMVRTKKNSGTNVFRSTYDECTIQEASNIRKIYCDCKTVLVPEGTKVLHDVVQTIEDKLDVNKDDYDKYQKALADKLAEVAPTYSSNADLCRGTFHTLVNGYDRVRVQTDGRKYQINKDVDNKSSDNDFEGSTKEAALHLVNKYHVSPQDAMKMLQKVATTGSTWSKEHHWYIQKTAADYNMSDVYGYERGSSPYDIPVEMGYTDRYEPGPQIDVISTEGRVFTAQSKEQLMDMIHQAAENGVKEVMDASVVKMMINTSSPMNLVGDYMRAFLTALDKIGRTLFLVMAHEDSFEAQYGEDQVSELVETLKNGMNAMSDTILFLRNKSLLSVDLTAAADQAESDLTTAITH